MKFLYLQRVFLTTDIAGKINNMFWAKRTIHTPSLLAKVVHLKTIFGCFIITYSHQQIFSNHFMYHQRE